MEHNDKTVGENIKRIRVAAGKSTVDFARDLGYSESLLEKIQSGDRPASAEILSAISAYSGILPNEIIYGDLSHIKKYCFTFEDIEQMDIAEFAEISSEVYIEIFQLYFPIIKDDESMKSEEFQRGIEIFDSPNAFFELVPTDYLRAINCFIRAYIDSKIEEAIVNILSSFGYLWLYYICTSLKNNFQNELQENKFSNAWDMQKVVNEGIDKSVLKMNIDTFLKNYNGKLTTYMSKAKNSKKYSDYAYYFLAIRYYLGMMDSSITKLDVEQEKMFGQSMLDCLGKMGNKYAADLQKYLGHMTE